MAFMGFMAGPSGHGLNTSWFIFSGGFLEIEKVYAVADHESDNCDFDKIEWDTKSKSTFTVHLKNIERKHISDKVSYCFHLIYTTAKDKMYKQTVTYNGDSNISAPKEVSVGESGISLLN